MKNKIYVKKDYPRIDKYLAEILEISRTKIQDMINDNLIQLNDKLLKKPGHEIKNGDLILITEKIIKNKIESDYLLYELDLDIKYEDEYFLIVNKPSGLLSHPTYYEKEITLFNALLFYFIKNKIDSKPLLVHRIDKDTSGLLIIAKNENSLEKLQHLFLTHEIEKRYYALVHDNFKWSHVLIKLPISRTKQNILKFQTSKGKNSKDAETEVFVLKRFESFCLVDCILITGRTHQIRLHLKSINHSILNDPLYGIENKTTLYGQYLICYLLKFIHPFTNKLIKIDLGLPIEFIEKMATENEKD